MTAALRRKPARGCEAETSSGGQSAFGFKSLCAEYVASFIHGMTLSSARELTKRPHLSKHVVLELLEEVHCKSFKTMPLESGNPSIAPLAVQSLAGISKRLEKGNLQLCARGLCTYIHQQAACFYGGMCSTRMQDCESQSAMMKEKPQKVDGLQCRMPPTSPFALSLEHLPSLKLTR